MERKSRKIWVWFFTLPCLLTLSFPFSAARVRKNRLTLRYRHIRANCNRCFSRRWCCDVSVSSTIRFFLASLLNRYMPQLLQVKSAGSHADFHRQLNAVSLLLSHRYFPQNIHPDSGFPFPFHENWLP
ncbi:MAG: hypothetical protein Ct9H300mP28_17990 [Pseudomonadota bacterium]|nr:MAG: hypothetical protein Ct9H300mP28_17990 [Pseudomonadota bacterium]